MRLRDAQFRPWEVFFVLDGVSDALTERLEQGLADLLSQSAGAPLRRDWPGRGRRLSRAAAERRAGAAVRRDDEGGPDAQLIARARHAGFSGLPISLTVAGDRLVVGFAHAVADGGGMIVLLQALLRSTLGLPVAQPADSAVRFPIVRALARVGPRAIVSALAARATNDVPPVLAPAPTPRQEALEDARLLTLRLDAELLARIRTARRGAGKGRATITTRVVSLALVALQETSHRQEDLRVGLPVDLRHLAGGRVDGNFVSTAPLGGLRSTAWTPSSISGRVAAFTGPTGLVAFAIGALRFARARGARRSPWREWVVSVSALSSESLPAAAWKDPRSARVGCATVGPWPSALFVLVWFAGEEAFLSIWDEGELIDLDRFEEEFRRELEQRELPRT